MRAVARLHRLDLGEQVRALRTRIFDVEHLDRDALARALARGHADGAVPAHPQLLAQLVAPVERVEGRLEEGTLPLRLAEGELLHVETALRPEGHERPRFLAVALRGAQDGLERNLSRRRGGSEWAGGLGERTGATA